MKTHQVATYKLAAAVLVGMSFYCQSAAYADTISSEVIIAMRVGERLLVTLAGIISLVLGYKLFSKVSDLGKLNAEVKDRLKLQMHNVGPGTFFALFGTVILIYVMRSAVDVPTSFLGTNQKDAPGSVRLNTGFLPPLDDKEKAAEYAHALEKVKQYASSGQRPSTAELEKQLRDYIDLTEQVQGMFVDQALGPGAYGDWKLIRQREQTEPDFGNTISSDRQKAFDAVTKVIDDGAL